MCVAFGHGAVFPLVAYAPDKTGLWGALIGLNNSAFNGVAAVMIFFIISGFCIHYKYACGEKFLLAPYLSRRVIRITIPVLTAIALANLLGSEARGALDAVLWSLYYEMIYYLIYPLLLVLFTPFTVFPWVACAGTLSATLIALNWHISYYWEFPISYGWLIPFPAWLLGCLLAEAVVRKKVWYNENKIWVWRLIGLSYAALVQAYFFHGSSKIGMPALLYPFIIYSFFWLDREITKLRSVGANWLLEWAGTWSYSIYLMHGIVLVVLKPSYPMSPALLWVVKLVAILIVSYSFYAMVEWPAHRFARRLSRRLLKWSWR
jgi:peptidoglycan/LPS O-acetylase OafA/YrhL